MLIGAVSLGTDVMIGAGIFAMSGGLFPLTFLSASLIGSLSAYTYVKLTNTLIDPNL